MTGNPLDGAGCLKFIRIILNTSKINYGVIKAVKLAFYCFNQEDSVSTFNEKHKRGQSASILAENSVSMFKKFSNILKYLPWLRRINTT